MIYRWQVLIKKKAVRRLSVQSSNRFCPNIERPLRPKYCFGREGGREQCSVVPCALMCCGVCMIDSSDRLFLSVCCTDRYRSVRVCVIGRSIPVQLISVWFCRFRRSIRIHSYVTSLHHTFCYYSVIDVVVVVVVVVVV